MIDKFKINSIWPSTNSLWDNSDITMNDNHVIYTDYKLKDVNLNIPIRFAWIQESPVVNVDDYLWIEKNNHLFSYVFTHQKYLLDKNENYLFCPGIGTWIKNEDKNIYIKNKLISIIASSKNYLIGHKLRHNIIKYKNNNNIIDVFGRSMYDGDIGYNPIENKIIGLKDYAFSIVVENVKQDYYFTEKLIDCFLAGTIPIYWGCPSISKFFNIKGMIIFDNIDDLDDILAELSYEKYNSMQKYIIENFEIAKKYNEPIEYIHKNYLQLFTKKTVKIKFHEFFPGFNPKDYWIWHQLSNFYELELSDNPDILIYSAWITDESKKERRKIIENQPNCIKIFYTLENIRPNFDECDIAISFDYTDNPKNIRLPYYVIRTMFGVDDINFDRLTSVKSFEDIDNAIQKIIEIDNNDDMFFEMQKKSNLINDEIQDFQNTQLQLFKLKNMIDKLLIEKTEIVSELTTHVNKAKFIKD